MEVERGGGIEGRETGVEQRGGGEGRKRGKGEKGGGEGKEERGGRERRRRGREEGKRQNGNNELELAKQKRSLPLQQWQKTKRWSNVK